MSNYKHGGDIYHESVRLDFSANINCFGMPEKVLEAALQGVEASIHYPDPKCTALKKAICDLEKRDFHEVCESQIVCGNGASDLIYRLVQRLRPKKGAVLAPGFEEYEQALWSYFETIGENASPKEQSVYKMVLHRENGYVPSIEDLYALPEDVDLLFLCNPGNPTGRLLPEDVVKCALHLANQGRFFLVMDECFLDFVSDEKRKSVTDHIGQCQNLFVLKAFTKMYGMPGLRLGYGLSGNLTLLTQMEEYNQPWGISVPAQNAGRAACYEQEFVKNTRCWLEKERQYVVNGLQDLGIKVIRGEANFLMFTTIPGLDKKLLKYGICIRNCSNYTGLAEGDYRIAIRKRSENDELLQALQDIMREENPLRG